MVAVWMRKDPKLFNRDFRIHLACLATLLMVGQDSANSQESAEESPPLINFPSPIAASDLPPETRPAPMWRAWKAMHNSLESLARDSIAPSEALTQLSPQEADAVLQAGYAYDQDLARIDAEARLEVLERFRPPHPPELPPGFVGRDVIQLPFGTSLREILEAEGYYSRVDDRKISLLASHREYIRQLIGSQKLEWLDRYIESVVAPSVRDVTRATRLAPGQTPETFREGLK